MQMFGDVTLTFHIEGVKLKGYNTAISNTAYACAWCGAGRQDILEHLLNAYKARSQDTYRPMLDYCLRKAIMLRRAAIVELVLTRGNEIQRDYGCTIKNGLRVSIRDLYSTTPSPMPCALGLRDALCAEIARERKRRAMKARLQVRQRFAPSLQNGLHCPRSLRAVELRLLSNTNPIKLDRETRRDILVYYIRITSMPDVPSF